MSQATPYPRDMVGYGRNPPDPNWPGGAAVAVQFVDQLRGGRREQHPARRRRLRGLPVRDRRRAALAGPAPHEHGVDLRIRLARRLLAAVAHVHGAAAFPSPSTASRTALQRNPEAVAAMKEADWEIASHGLKWIDYRDYSKDDERAHMAEAIRIHTEVTGERPLGWYTGRSSRNTTRIVMEEGGFLYSSDTYADDLPYWVKGPQGPAPHHPLHARRQRHALRDAAGLQFRRPVLRLSEGQFRRALRGGPSRCPEDDVGRPPLPSRRPARTRAALARFLDYVQSKTASGCAARIDIARHWHATHPPGAGKGST